MWRQRVLVCALLIDVLSGRARAQAPVLIGFLDGDTQAYVRRAVEGAAARLARPGCQDLFEDFTDVSGQRLATTLAEERRALLRDLGRELHALPALRSNLERSFDPVGELLDTASPRDALVGWLAAVAAKQSERTGEGGRRDGVELAGGVHDPILRERLRGSIWPSSSASAWAVASDGSSGSDGVALSSPPGRPRWKSARGSAPPAERTA